MKEAVMESTMICAKQCCSRARNVVVGILAVLINEFQSSHFVFSRVWHKITIIIYVNMCCTFNLYSKI